MVQTAVTSYTLYIITFFVPENALYYINNYVPHSNDGKNNSMPKFDDLVLNH